MQFPPRPALSAGTTLPEFQGRPDESLQPLQKTAPIRPQEDSALLYFWQFLKRNYGWPLAGLILGIAIAVVLTVSQTPTFRATATLEIQDLNENFLNLKEVSPIASGGAHTDAVQNDLQTQLRVLLSFI